MYEGPLAVAVFCFNRSHYLRRLCETLANQEDLGRTTFYFFQDGAINQFSQRKAAEQQDVNHSRSEAAQFAALMGPWHRTIIRTNKHNVGVAIQQYHAYEELKKIFRYVVFLDDDVVLSPYYMRVTRLLIPLMEQQGDVFSASPCFTRDVKMQLENIPKHLHEVEYGHFPWIGYVADLEKWDVFKPTFMRYYDLMKAADYRTRPGPAILKLHEQHGHKGRTHTSQDAWKDVAMDVHGIKKIRCRVNRGMYIGKVGIHGSPAHYARSGWARHKPFVHEQDAVLEELTLV